MCVMFPNEARGGAIGMDALLDPIRMTQTRLSWKLLRTGLAFVLFGLGSRSSAFTFLGEQSCLIVPRCREDEHETNQERFSDLFTIKEGYVSLSCRRMRRHFRNTRTSLNELLMNALFNRDHPPQSTERPRCASCRTRVTQDHPSALPNHWPHRW